MPALPASAPTAPGPVRRVSPLVVVLQLLGALALVLVPTAALAHDRLVSSDPADGSSVETSPTAVTLTFSDTPLSVSPVVRVTGSDGQTVFDGAPTIVDTQATATLERPLPAGTATVEWRVVSADGHPIEGSFTFEVLQATQPSAAPTVSPSSESAAAASPAASSGTTEQSTVAEPSASATAEAASTGGGLSPAVIALIAVPVVVVLGVAAWFLLRRRGPHQD